MVIFLTILLCIPHLKLRIAPLAVFLNNAAIGEKTELQVRPI